MTTVGRTLLLFFSGVLIAFVGRGAEYEFRTWTSVKGDSIRACFLKMDEKYVELQGTDGKTFKIAFTALVSSDQTFINDNYRPRTWDQVIFVDVKQVIDKARIKRFRGDNAGWESDLEGLDKWVDANKNGLLELARNKGRYPVERLLAERALGLYMRSYWKETQDEVQNKGDEENNVADRGADYGVGNGHKGIGANAEEDDSDIGQPRETGRVGNSYWQTQILAGQKEQEDEAGRRQLEQRRLNEEREKYALRQRTEDLERDIRRGFGSAWKASELERDARAMGQNNAADELWNAARHLNEMDVKNQGAGWGQKNNAWGAAGDSDRDEARRNVSGARNSIW